MYFSETFTMVSFICGSKEVVHYLIHLVPLKYVESLVLLPSSIWIPPYYWGLVGIIFLNLKSHILIAPFPCS